MWDFASEHSNTKFQVPWDYGAETWPNRAKYILFPASFRDARRAFPCVQW